MRIDTNKTQELITEREELNKDLANLEKSQTIPAVKSPKLMEEPVDIQNALNSQVVDN